MKGSLKLRPKRALNRKEAWACFSANLALAGSGSLAAGRAVGYVQMAAVFLAMIMTFVTSISFIKWKLSGGGVAQSPMDDAYLNMEDIWLHVRWPLVSIVLYAASVLWALTTSLSILANASKDAVPPRIT
jgi:hypothetical protein